MYAIHSTLLAPSAVHHTLYLPHFTPSTIYPLPRASTSTAPDVKVVGNLIVGGLSDLRVFEIREEERPVLPAIQSGSDANGLSGAAASQAGDAGLDPAAGMMVDGQEVGDSFFDTGPSQVRLKLACIVSCEAIIRHERNALRTDSILARTTAVQDPPNAAPPHDTPAARDYHGSRCTTNDRQ